MTTLGLIFILVAGAAALRFGRAALPWLLSAGIAFPVSAALVAGSNAVYPFFLTAFVVAIAVIAWFLSRQRGVPATTEEAPGRRALLLFTAWCCLITVFAPLAFAGIPVLDPRAGVDEQVFRPNPLQFTVSNLAQLLYVLLGVAVVIFLARAPKLSPAVPALGFGLGTGLSSLQLTAEAVGLPWPRHVFSNSPNVRYIDMTSEGELRFRGLFAEPSMLATFSITALVFFILLASHRAGRARAGYLALAGLSLLNLLLSEAGTAVVAGAAIALVVVGRGLYRFLAGRSRWQPGLVGVGLAGFVVAVWFAPQIFASAVDLLSSKLGSGGSYEVRSAANLFSLQVLADTWGLGAGLGSNRPSSFATMLISCVGVVGTALFLAAVVPLVRSAARRPEWRPTAWALVAFFITKSVAGANMSEPLMWLCLGVCAHAAWAGASGLRAVANERGAPATTLGR